MNPLSTAPVTHPILDRQHGIVAAQFAHPASWQAQSEVQWNMQHYSSPCRVFARAYDPASAAQVEFFPVEQLCWIEPNIGMQQPGQMANGGATYLPPMLAADALLQWLLPRYRNHCQNLRIVGVGNIAPQYLMVPSAFPADQSAQREAVCVRIEYLVQNRAIEEEFYALKTAFPGIPTHGMAGTLVQYNWGFERVFSFRADKGQLDPLREPFWHIASSVQVNPQWEQLMAQVLQQLKQQFDNHIQAGYENIAAANRLSQQISAGNQQFLQHQQERRDADWASHQQRMQAWNAQPSYTQTDAFGDMMMGRETYHDPYYQYGSQHSGYNEYVWTDSQGNYQYSNDANFDPNINSSQNWTLMRKKQVGE